MTSLSGAQTRELTVEDFSFQEPLGSQGTSLERLGKNHFRVKLGHAPNQPDWGNKVQFRIKSGAKGNTLRLDAVGPGKNQYTFSEYFHSFSYDGKEWHPVQWRPTPENPKERATLLFPEFTEDSVIVGHQVPLSYEDLLGLIAEWKKSPHVRVVSVGKSLGGRDIYRVVVTDAASPHPESARWVHYFTNQHPGEHNSQWRMVAMLDWLLSDEGADCRKRSICHFIVMMSPDAPSNGWYRVNAQGVDMNRSYRAAGSDKDAQAHEAYLCQKDLEALMASPAPVTDLWSMHTWGGIVEPICVPGPEMGAALGPWTDLRDAIVRSDPKKRVKPIKAAKVGNGNAWNNGPHLQFGITTFLCEGAGALFTKEENLESGVALIRGIAEYYRGVRGK